MDRYETDKKEREKKDRTDVSIIAVYVIVAFLTYGYVTNHSWDCSTAERSDKTNCEMAVAIGPFIYGAVWPVYLLGSFATWVTRWP